MFPFLRYAYWTVLALAVVYVVMRGGKPERQVVGVIAVGSVLTPLAHHTFGQAGWSGAQIGNLAVDAAVLAFLLYIALTSDRFWPMWVAPFHIIGTATHLAIAIDRSIVPLGYALMQGFWAYPMLAVTVAGAAHHYRNGMLRHDP